ncbi:hypothetical protein D3C78_1552590 [compost metagenome]
MFVKQLGEAGAGALQFKLVLAVDALGFGLDRSTLNRAVGYFIQFRQGPLYQVHFAFDG